MQTVFSRLFASDPIGRAVLIAAGAIAVYLAIANFAFGDGVSAISNYGKYLSLALLALSLDLLWGYLGVLSLGHGAFFALGGYAIAIYMTRSANAEIANMPWFWAGLDNPFYAVLLVMIVPGIVAFVFGYFAFRSKVTGVYLSIITQAFAFALSQFVGIEEAGFGGSNGQTNFKAIFGFDLSSDATRTGLMIASFLALIGGYAICRGIVKSRLGRVAVSIRDCESRVGFLGYRIVSYKLFIFVVAAVLAGVAGALYAPQAGSVTPKSFGTLFSIAIVVWVAIGGRGTLYGAIIGAIVVGFAESYFTTVSADSWQYILGALFVVVTLFLPKGIAGAIASLQARFVKTEAAR